MSNRTRLSWKAVILIAFLALVGAAVWTFYRAETWPQRTTREVLRAFRDVAQIQPHIVVNDRVVFEQTKDALELAVVTRETSVEREMEHEWLGSKKRIRLRGTYIVKAGFDLQEKLSVRIEDRQVHVDLPDPKILSVDPRDTEVLVLEDGYWNKIRPAELEAELKALPELARNKAIQSGLTGEALETFKRRLQGQFAPRYDIEFVEAPLPLP